MSRRRSTVEQSRITISLPVRLHQLFDSIRKEQGYATISEAIRDLIRLYVERTVARNDKEGRELGIIAYILPQSPNERKQMLISELARCEAKFRDIVQSVSMTMRGGKVMRVAIVCGDVNRITKFKDAVEALKDVNVITSSGWRIKEVKEE